MTRKKRETVNSREDIHMFPYQAKENRLVKNSILPTERELKLSESYLMKVVDPMLELKVKVININPNAGHEILEKCEVMRQYSEFIETVRKYQVTGDANVYYHAILECMNNGILTEYLSRKGSEVVNMLQAEYDYEMDVAVQREEAREEGRAEGRAETLYSVLVDVLELKGGLSEKLSEIIKKYMIRKF